MRLMIIIRIRIFLHQQRDLDEQVCKQSNIGSCNLVTW